MGFGTALKELLTKKNMSMTELSKRTGITYNMIKRYCIGNADPTISYAKLIAEVLEVSLDSLMDYTPATQKTMLQQVFEEDFTLIKGFLRNVRRFGSKTAVIDPLTDKKVTYKELNDDVNMLANAFMDNGVEMGDVVLYQLPNSLEFLYCYLAPQKLGAINSPASYNFSSKETAICLETSKPAIYIYDSSIAAMAIRALEMSSWKPTHIIMVGDAELPSGHIRLTSFMKGYPSIEPKTQNTALVYDEVTRLYTSGTTGNPKGVPLYNLNEVLSAHDVMMHFPMNSTDITMNTTPWFHRGGLHAGGPTPTLYAGGTMIIMRNFQSLLTLKYVEKYRISFLIGVPSIIKMLVRQQEKYNGNLSSLKGIVTMGAPFERADFQKVLEVLSPNLFNGYGTTESFWNTFLRPYNLPELSGTAGMSCTDDDVRVVKYVEGEMSDPDNFAAMDESEVGEVIVRSPKASYHYFNNPEEDAIKFKDGWMYTGDLAVWDKNQFITIAGRKDDMIISGGENIYPPIIEEALNLCPGVAQSAVTSVPDASRGEAVVAYIVPADDTLTISDLVDFCSESDVLSGFKRPRYYRFVKELPMTTTGKLQHYLVKEMALNDLEHGLLRFAIKKVN